MRHSEPHTVTVYRQTLKARPPKVCHTCDHYDERGICAEFSEAPPEDFAQQDGACKLWQEEVPF
jgi:hypothetical protein